MGLREWIVVAQQLGQGGTTGWQKQERLDNRRALSLEQLLPHLLPSCSLLPLAWPGAAPAPAAAVVALVAAVAWQGFTYAGFHSYVQDVAPSSAGLVLAVTNSCGTLVGIGGNLVTGHLAASRWGYAGEATAGGGWGGVRWVVGWWSVGCAAEPMIALA